VTIWSWRQASCVAPARSTNKWSSLAEWGLPRTDVGFRRTAGAAGCSGDGLLSEQIAGVESSAKGTAQAAPFRSSIGYAKSAEENVAIRSLPRLPRSCPPAHRLGGLTAARKSLGDSGIPRKTWAPRSSKPRPEPATRSGKAPETRISLLPASSAMRAAIWMAMPPTSAPRLRRLVRETGATQTDVERLLA
jgi:hypothetical protein